MEKSYNKVKCPYCDKDNFSIFDTQYVYSITGTQEIVTCECRECNSMFVVDGKDFKEKDAK